MISGKLKEAVKLSSMKSYEIAHAANLHPSTLSRIMCGIERVKDGDPRVLRVCQVLGLKPEDCLEGEGYV